MSQQNSKNYKQLVAKVYAEAKKNNIEWPDKFANAVTVPIYKGFLYNDPVGSGGYYHFIKLLVAEMQPKVVLELGSCNGLGIISVMTTLPEKSKFISVDIKTDLSFVPDEIHNDERFRYINGNCLDLQIYKNDTPKNIDLLICDTIHTYKQLEAEVATYKSLLADEAVILVDDLDYSPTGGAKRKYYNGWPGEKEDLSKYCHSSGYGALIFKRDK
jgi:predicted O-methyltransferase YrrM